MMPVPYSIASVLRNVDVMALATQEVTENGQKYTSPDLLTGEGYHLTFLRLCYLSLAEPVLAATKAKGVSQVSLPQYD